MCFPNLVLASATALGDGVAAAGIGVGLGAGLTVAAGQAVLRARHVVPAQRVQPM